MDEEIEAPLKLLNLVESPVELYAYAIIATAIVIVVLLLLACFAARIGGEAAISLAADGQTGGSILPHFGRARLPRLTNSTLRDGEREAAACRFLVAQ